MGGLVAGAGLMLAASARAEGAIDQIAAQLLQDFEADYGQDHPETLLCALGAHAGFGCQMAVWEAVRRGAIPRAKAFVVVTTTDGGTYYYGDTLNQPLLEAKISVWGLVAGAAQKAGAKDLPDIHEIVAFVAGSVGGPAFGTIRVPAAHQPAEKPFDTLKNHWAAAAKRLQDMDYNPMFTGWYFASAAQRIILDPKVNLDPALATRIVMEAAVSMSKIDPVLLGVKVS